MAFRRVSAALGSLALVAVVAAPAYAQDKPKQQQQQEKRKLSKDEQTQYEAIHALVDAVESGKQPAPADFKVTFRPDFLKSNDNVYIPFTLSIDPKPESVPLALYVRAIAKGAAAPADAAAAKNAKPKEGEAKSYPWEDISFVTPTPDNKIQRALAVAPGDYDVYIAIAEKPGKDKKAAKTTVSVQPLTVPNLLTGLSTSSVILAKSIDPGTALTGQQQLEQPYMLSGYKVTLAPEGGFSKSGELLWVYYIYNEGEAANGKPDLFVEYNFFHKGEDKPFVNMPPTSYNATSNLPPEFNLKAGHTVFVAQGVPLTTINPGDYRLQIKITDKTNNQTITKDVPFTVVP